MKTFGKPRPVATLKADAERLGLEVSHLSDEALTVVVSKALREEWQRENREAIESFNKWVEQNGLPLAKYRQF